MQPLQIKKISPARTSPCVRETMAHPGAVLVNASATEYLQNYSLQKIIVLNK